VASVVSPGVARVRFDDTVCAHDPSPLLPRCGQLPRALAADRARPAARIAPGGLRVAAAEIRRVPGPEPERRGADPGARRKADGRGRGDRDAPGRPEPGSRA